MKTPTIGKFLDAEEEELITQIERDADKFISIMTPEMKAYYEKAAARTFEQREKISLRLRMGDLLRLKARARREGVPYQTLINSILHQAVADEKL